MSEPRKISCSDVARAHAIPLVGTAPWSELWFLLEYNSVWGAKAFEESTIPEVVKNHLTSENSPRILLVRKGSAQQEGLRFFIGQIDPLDPKFYEYHLQTYLDILDIDLAPLAKGLPGDPAYLRDEPLFLACTNGKRDLCCARYGPEVFQAMKETAEDAVWQCSHIGGHNKAPVTLFFPHGVNYGRTSAEDVRDLIHKYQDGYIGLEHYRGRVCYDAPVQAAEHFWRQETGILDLPGIKLDAVEPVGENGWRIGVSGVDGNNRRQFHIQRRESEFEIPISCSKAKVEKIGSFHRI